MIDLTTYLDEIKTPILDDKYSLELWNTNISSLKSAIEEVNNSVVNPADYIPPIRDITVYVQPVVNIIATVLDSEKWEDNQYSFEEEYPKENYDIEIEINGDLISEEQIAAWSAAKIRGSALENKYYSSEAPIIDIPIILKAVQKNQEPVFEEKNEEQEIEEELTNG